LNKLDNVEKKIDNIPSHHTDEGNLRQLLDKLVSVENKIDILGKPSWPARRENINDRPSGVSSPSVNNPRPAASSSALGLPSRLWSEAVKSPTTAGACSNFTQPSDHVMDTDTDDGGLHSDGFKLVDNKKRRRVASKDSRLAQTEDHSQPRPKPKTVIGRNATASLKAAKELHKKRIFCVSNVSDNTTCDELKATIEQNSIKVFNVFAAKTRFKDSLAFRVSIDVDDVDKFTDESIWAADIIIREWVFKKTEESK
jgi:hypothetical protein